MSNASRYIGVAGNVYGGTALGEGNSGSANNSIGGTVYRAAGQSSNQFPVSPADAEANNNGGPSAVPSNTSSNPPTVQAEVLNDATSQEQREAVAQTTPANVSAPAAGNYLTFPKTTETIELGTGSVNSTSSNLTINRQQPENAYVGITDTLFNGNSNDLEVLAEERRVVQGTNAETDGRVDGKAQGANSVDKFQSVNGANLMTEEMKELPGGVAISPEIGEENVSGLGI